MESLKRTDNDSPIGELATYTLNSTATPVDPSDTSGALPSFSATVTDVVGDAKRLKGLNVSLRDWTGFRLFDQETGTRTKGRVTAVSKGNGIVNIEASTIFERLNTEQTVLPVTIQDTTDATTQAVFREGILQMCLAAGVPTYSVEGYLQHYVSKNSQIGYMADNKHSWRFFGPPTSYRSYVTTEGALGGYAPPLEVNPAQSIIVGFMTEPSEDLTEFRLEAYLPHIQNTVRWTFRRVGNSYYILERIGTGSTTQLQAFVKPLLNTGPAWVMVRFRANAADATKVDITSRVIELDTTNFSSVYSDFTANGVVSTMRNRPQPFKLELGYDSSLTSGRTPGTPDSAWVVNSDVLQENYPDWQIYVSTQVSSNSGSADRAKLPQFIAGFTGNVWDKLRELCAIYDYDIEYNKDQIGFVPREQKRRALNNSFIPASPLEKGDLSESVENREPAKSVEVNVYKRVVDSDYNSVMFKADSVYTLEKGETKVEKVQTENSFHYLSQPVPVSGVPVPYTSAFGSYVVTGNDGYIVDPQWWKDNGGSITVASTGVSGEIEITMQAPTVDTVRAPYRISEGVADRPALYIMGYGIALQDPKPVKILTGEPKASQDVGATLDSKFVTTDIAAYNAGNKLASIYGSGVATVNFSTSRADYDVPADSVTKPTPLADSVYWSGSYYRISSLSLTPNGMQFSDCQTHNTVGVINGEFAESKTIADWNALHDGKTIVDINLAPLPYYES